MPKNSKFGGWWWWPGWWKWSKTRDHLHWARRPGQPPLILNFTPNFSWSCAPQFNKLTWLTSLIWDPDNFPPFDERPREACRKKLCTWMGFAKKKRLVLSTCPPPKIYSNSQRIDSSNITCLHKTVEAILLDPNSNAKLKLDFPLSRPLRERILCLCNQNPSQNITS